LVVLHAALCTLWVWHCVGTWRSAARHTQRGGKSVWASLARCTVAIGLFRLLLDLTSVSMPVVFEHVRIAVGDDRFGAIEFRLMRNGTELELSGGIGFGAAKELERILATARDLRTLTLNSPGGRFSEATAIASQVRKRRLDTHVVEQCHSACTIVFLAGRERRIGTTGQLGFHEPAIPGVKREHLASMIQREKDRLLAMGVRPDFVTRALDTPNASIWIPSHAELVEAGVVTRSGERMRSPASAVLDVAPTADRLLLSLLRKTSMVLAWPETYFGDGGRT
jgi:hypothetical protein